MNICWIINSTTPYHAARMSALAAILPMRPTLIEWTDRDEFAVLECRSSAQVPYQRMTLLSGGALHALTARRRKEILWAALDGVKPAVVCVNGWGMQSSRAMIDWCIRRGVPAVVMSESTAHDMPRVWWREAIKRHLVGLFSAAVVGGSAHVAYLEQLEFPRGRIFTGYDVVDNEYFSRAAASALDSGDSHRRRLGLPTRYFLTCSRFTEKKNLSRVLTAYDRYRRMSAAPWELVFVGDGPLRSDLGTQRERLGLRPFVHMPGAIGYGELPVFYALASAFVHASTSEQWGLVVNEAMASGLPVLVSERCGCAPDLVANGRNGYQFDPFDPDALAEVMYRISSSPQDAAEMGQVSRSIIQKNSPGNFASAVLSAAEMALSTPRRMALPLERLLLSVT